MKVQMIDENAFLFTLDNFHSKRKQVLVPFSLNSQIHIFCNTNLRVLVNEIANWLTIVFSTYMIDKSLNISVGFNVVAIATSLLQL